MIHTMHAPVSAPTREAGTVPDAADQPQQQTVRVPIVYPPPTAAAALITTPPPSGDRKLSRSVFNDTNADESGVGLRVGDTFLGFNLVEELGQGAFARVFLAHQQSLAGRPVALKVTLRPTREAERLARLQHTNVVPVYSVHNAPPAQVICMPFLGRRTVADVIRVYRNDHPSREYTGRKTSGTRAARTTDVVESGSRTKVKPGPIATPKPRPAVTGTPALIGDPLAVLKVIGQLSAGLAHAHSRNILHLDLKPANVLLPDIGEPMLLDFNLSFDTTIADRELVGGTVPYMATEQLLDLRTRGRGAVDARTDLYSLGVMAFEMLTGEVPFPASSKDLIDMDGLIAVRRQGPPSIRELNPDVSPATEAIVHKLLAPEPKDRYQTAEELKVDIDRHLNNLPLAFAREPSLRERFGKWRRRNPGVAGRLLAASLFGLVLGGVAIAFERSEANATARASARVQHTRAALDTTRLDLILPGDAKARARGIAKAEELLAAYNLPADHQWMKQPDVQRLSEQERAALASDLGELMLLLAQAKWQEAEPKNDSSREHIAAMSLKLNKAARMCFPLDAMPALVNQQDAELAFAAGQQAEAVAVPDHKPTAREKFLDGVSQMRSTKYAAAIALLEAAIAEQPNHATAHFCLAYSRQQLGQFERALERYDVAEKLMPSDPRPLFQRGMIYANQLNFKAAEKEYNRAIELASDHVFARRNLGFTRYRLADALAKEGKDEDAKSKLKEAEADLTLALEMGASPSQIHTYRMLVRRSLGDAAGALADQGVISTLTPTGEADYITRGNARLKAEDWKGALDDFIGAAEFNPRSLMALQNQVHVLGDKLNQLEDAVKAANRLIEFYPDYAAGRMAKAVFLARLNRRDEAVFEADKAMGMAKKDHRITYRGACVYSLTSVNNPADRKRAVELLDQAIKDGFHEFKTLENDSDLAPIRDTRRFHEIVDAARSLFQ